MNKAYLTLLVVVSACGAPQQAPSETSATPAPTTPATATATATATAAPAPTTTEKDATPPPQKTDADLFDMTGNVCDGTPVDTTAKGVGKVKTGALQVNGRIAPDDIKKVGEHNRARIVGCNTGVSGRVAVHLGIDSNGKVLLSKVELDETTPKGSNVAACIARSFCDLAFPKPTSGVTTAIYPVELSKK